MKSPVVQFIIGSVFGGLIACTITLHIVTNQVQSRTAAMGAANTDLAKAQIEALNTAEKVIAAWQTRAETCEGKFKVGTVVYEKQEVASIPMFGGLATLRLGAGSGMRPSLYIPAQVDIYTERADVRYQWVDGRSGEAKAVQIARSPSEAK